MFSSFFSASPPTKSSFDLALALNLFFFSLFRLFSQMVLFLHGIEFAFLHFIYFYFSVTRDPGLLASPGS